MPEAIHDVIALMSGVEYLAKTLLIIFKVINSLLPLPSEKKEHYGQSMSGNRKTTYNR